MIYYHGAPEQFTTFDLSKCREESAMQNGPGIYLTEEFEDACQYGPFIHVVQVYGRTFSERNFEEEYMELYGETVEDFVRSMIAEHAKRCPDSHDVVMSNWGYDAGKLIDSIVSSGTPVQQTWYELFRMEEEDFFPAARFCGVQGLEADPHLVHYDPSDLTIIRVEDHDQQTLWRRDANTCP